MRARHALLGDGRRLHMQDGPIDLVVEAFGPEQAVAGAYDAAMRRFGSVLDELCDELHGLRQGADPHRCRLSGPVARRMHAAVAPFAAEGFITPMAAVAGAVAEEILATMLAAGPLERAYVNNGGDIALYLAPGHDFVLGLVDRPDRPGIHGHARIDHAMPVRGAATSGWRGRSFSLGIADAVTVLAATAAMADAAATVIANAVDLPGNPVVLRVPACEIQPESDLGERFVTRHVGPLSDLEVAEALAAGAARAEQVVERDLARGAVLHLRGESRIVGPVEVHSMDGRDSGTPALALAPEPRASLGAAHRHA